MTVKKRHALVAFLVALTLHALPLLSFESEFDSSMGSEGIGAEGLTVGVGLAGSFDTSRFQKRSEENDIPEEQEQEMPEVEEIDDTEQQVKDEIQLDVTEENIDERPEEARPVQEEVVHFLDLAVSEGKTSEHTLILELEAANDHIDEPNEVQKNTEVVNELDSQLSIQATGIGSTKTSGGNPASRLTYNTKIQTRIARFKRYPRSARKQGVTGTVTIAFSLNKRGRVTYSSIVKSSGDPRLDKEALSLLIRAEPFPAIPEEMSEDSIDFTLPIEFSLNTHRRIF